jgi:hypothetical protein
MARKNHHKFRPMSELKEAAALLEIPISPKETKEEIADAIERAEDAPMPEVLIAREKHPAAVEFGAQFAGKKVFWVGAPIRGIGISVENPGEADVYAFHSRLAPMHNSKVPDEFEKAFRALRVGGICLVVEQCLRPGIFEFFNHCARGMCFYDFRFQKQVSPTEGVWLGTKPPPFGE